MVLLMNIIGAGNLGKTIGHLLVKNQLVKIGAICNTTQKSTLDAIKFIGDGVYCSEIDLLPPADITLISTPDDLISVMCKKLSENGSIKQGSIVLHCSGSLTSDVLFAAQEKGAYIASIHPMRSFAKPELSIEEYNGTYCAMEGDKEAISRLRQLFDSIGSKTYEINKEKKSLYHASGVFASNYVVTLSEQALLCLKEAGVENEMAMHVITNLMRSAISNLERTLSPKQSLTGPIQRGDVSTVKDHMGSFTDAAQKQLYSSLGRATLSLTNHDSTKKASLEEALKMTEEPDKVITRSFQL